MNLILMGILDLKMNFGDASICKGLGMSNKIIH